MRLAIKTVTCLVAVLGILWGIFVLSALGVREIDSSENGWHLLGCFAAGLVCSVASCIAVWNRRRAALAFLLTALLILLLGLARPFRAELDVEDIWIFGSLPFFGLLWHFTSQAGWPPVFAQRATTRRKVVIGILASVGLTCLVVIGAVVLTMLPSRLFVDCSWPHSFTAARYKGRLVFVATLQDPGVGVVKESFRGLRERAKYVLIAHWGIGHNELNGKTYFVEGRYANGWITRFLPIVDTTYCGRKRRVEQAALDLRILRDGFSPNAVRIVGQVRGKSDWPRFNARIVVVGPTGSVGARTDAEGIFELKNLRPGRYELRVEQCDARQSSNYYWCRANADLMSGDTWGVELRFDQ